MGYHLRIKICGVTNEVDARVASYLGADAIGLNFAAESPRRVDKAAAAAILREMPPFVEPVGVFVNTHLKQIYSELQPLGRVLTIQWHGANRELIDTFPYRLISAFQVRDAKSMTEIERYLEMTIMIGQPPAAILVDGYAADKHGGTGQTAPWELLANFRPPLPVILAGGLTPDNVAEAVKRVKPWGIDVASGVESAVGKKDPDKLRRFIALARNAAYQAS